ncbi:MAG: hypothetical protein AAB276_03700 [Pseudomonadota bacterium]
MKQNKLSQEIPRDIRERLSCFGKASVINREFMHKILDFVHDKFALLPRVSEAGQICFQPQFCAIIYAGTRDACRITLSLFGEKFKTGHVSKGKYPTWRKFTINNSDDLKTAENLIREAYQHRIDANYNGTWKFDEENKQIVEYYLTGI